jgi:acetyl esterase/lipase
MAPSAPNRLVRDTLELLSGPNNFVPMALLPNHSPGAAVPEHSLVDPELIPLLEIFGRDEFALHTIPMIRQSVRDQVASTPVPQDLPVTVSEEHIPCPAGAPPVRIVIYQPECRRPAPAIVHMHGGGYVIGMPEMMAVSHRQLAVALGCTIISVDYRLAPETPHPGPIEDCYAALRWVHHNHAALEIDPYRIGVAGESAGGGLAAALALLARDRGEVPLLFQHLIAPMIDDRTGSPHDHVGQHIWTPQHNQLGWSCLLGHPPGGDNVSPYAAAARAEQLAGLPPAFITVGALDLFLEQDLEYARRLGRAGVPVELHIYPGAFHAFELMSTARVAIAAARDALESLRRAFEGSTRPGS